MITTTGSRADRAGATGSVAPPGRAAAPVALSSADIAGIRSLLERLDPTLPAAHSPDDAAAPVPSGAPGLSESQCVDLLRELEDLKASAAGAQAAVTAHFAAIREDA